VRTESAYVVVVEPQRGDGRLTEADVARVAGQGAHLPDGA
jgi:hypothetical protein